MGSSTGDGRAPVDLAISALDVSPELQPDDGQLVQFVALAPRPDRALTALCVLDEEDGRKVRTVPTDDREPLVLPMPAEATGTLIVDGAESVRVYSTVIRDGHRVIIMDESADLEDWTSIELKEPAPATLAAGTADLLAFAPRDGAIAIRKITADATVEELTAVPVPAEQHWEVTAIATAGGRIALLVEAQAVDSGEDPAPVIIESTDGGQSWSAPRTLTGTGREPKASQLRALRGGLIVIGTQLFDSHLGEGITGRRPTAWFSSAAGEFQEEQIPMMTWGIENMERDDIPIDKQASMDFMNTSAGQLVVDTEGAAHLLIWWGDTAAHATRAVDGTWSLGESTTVSTGQFDGGVVTPEGGIARNDQFFHSFPLPAAAPTPLLRFAPEPSLSAIDGAPEGTVGLATRFTLSKKRSDKRIRMYQTTAPQTLVLYGDQITRGTDLPVSGGELDDVTLHRLPEGNLLVEQRATVVTDAEFGQTDSRTRLWVGNDDGGWVEVDGLAEDVDRVGRPVPVGERTCLPVSSLYEDNDNKRRLPEMLTLHDASLQPWGNVEDALGNASEAGASGHIVTVLDSDNGPIGLGHTWDDDDSSRPAVFQLHGETWQAQPADDAWRTAHCDGGAMVFGTPMMAVAGRPVAVRLAVDADGALTEVYRSNDGERRDLPRELTSRVAIASGWVDRPGEAIGACVWITVDGGEHWDPVVLPGCEGRFTGTALSVVGKDVLILTHSASRLRAFRIADLIGQVGAVPEASDAAQ